MVVSSARLRNQPSQFAKWIGVNLAFSEKLEPHRSRASEPARALLKIVAFKPKAIEALHT
jgi:DNA-binding transcriptional regulator YiaG